MSDIIVVTISAVALAAIAWSQKGDISPAKSVLFGMGTFLCVVVIACRGAHALGLRWFAEPLAPLDSAILTAASVAFFIRAVREFCRSNPLKNVPGYTPSLIGSRYLLYCAARDTIYFAITYVYVTKSVELLLRAVGFDTTMPMDVLKRTTFIALLGYGAVLVVNAVTAIIRWGQAGGDASRSLDANGLL